MTNNTDFLNVSSIGSRFRRALYYRGFSCIEECAALLLKMPADQALRHVELEYQQRSTLISSALGLRHEWLRFGYGHHTDIPFKEWLERTTARVDLPEYILQAAATRARYEEIPALPFAPLEPRESFPRLREDPTIPVVEELQEAAHDLWTCSIMKLSLGARPSKTIRATLLDAAELGIELAERDYDRMTPEYIREQAAALMWHEGVGMNKLIESGAGRPLTSKYDQILRSIRTTLVLAADYIGLNPDIYELSGQANIPRGPQKKLPPPSLKL